MADREVLIFWCLKRVRWKNILFFRVGSNWWVGSSQTESLMKWVSNTPEHLWHPKISPRSIETPLQTPKKQKRHNQIPTDSAKCLQTFSPPLKNAWLSQTGTNLLFWQNSERQEFFHLTLFRPQNIKTTSKNHWVWPFFLFFMSVREKLQFTVSLDHPVSWDVDGWDRLLALESLPLKRL